MRCPKCHYLSFEPEPRCRNCGYDLTLEPADLVVRPDPADEPAPDLDLVLRLPEPVDVPPSAAASSTIPAGVTAELPLFVQGLSDQTVQTPTPEPIRERPQAERSNPPAVRAVNPNSATLDPRSVAPPAAVPGPRGPEGPTRSPGIEEHLALPRAPRPLSVRRPTPAPGRVREKYQHAAAGPRREIGLLERDLLEGLEASPKPVGAPAPPVVPVRASNAEPLEELTASTGRRLSAALVDFLFLGAINAGIVWLTLTRLDLTIGQLSLLPILPVVTLLFLVDGLYLLMFTATNGQTIGKMTAGIRVVGTDDDALAGDRVTLNQAVLRALFTFPSVLVLGAGFLPLFGGGLPLHDRLAHTRVVRA